jgi:acyl carrier protein
MNSLEIVYLAVDRVNALSDHRVKIEKNVSTPLLGEGSVIDSLMLVDLIFAVEQVVQDTTGMSITLVDETVFADPGKPLNSLGSLAGYLDRVTHG